jgi:hypothetical protein
MIARKHCLRNPTLEVDAMAQSFATLQPSYVPEGFRLAGKVQGLHVGEFWGSREQMAVRYRQSRGAWGLGAEITVCWAPEKDLMLTGTTGRKGTPVDIGGTRAIYHDGMWMPGAGPDEQHFAVDGVAHWGKELVHSLTVHTSEGVFGLRAPRESVPRLAELVKIMSSVKLPD